MPFRIDSASLPDVIQVVFAGETGVQDRAEALDAALPLVMRQSRILVDFSDAVLVPPSTPEANRHAERLALAFAALPEVRIAYVTTASSRGPLMIAVLAALRGFYYRSFLARDEALDWLRDDTVLASPFVFPK